MKPDTDAASEPGDQEERVWKSVKDIQSLTLIQSQFFDCAPLLSGILKIFQSLCTQPLPMLRVILEVVARSVWLLPERTGTVDTADVLFHPCVMAEHADVRFLRIHLIPPDPELRRPPSTSGIRQLHHAPSAYRLRSFLYAPVPPSSGQTRGYRPP